MSTSANLVESRLDLLDLAGNVKTTIDRRQTAIRTVADLKNHLEDTLGDAILIGARFIDDELVLQNEDIIKDSTVTLHWIINQEEVDSVEANLSPRALNPETNGGR